MPILSLTLNYNDVFIRPTSHNLAFYEILGYIITIAQGFRMLRIILKIM